MNADAQSCSAPEPINGITTRTLIEEIRIYVDLINQRIKILAEREDKEAQDKLDKALKGTQ